MVDKDMNKIRIIIAGSRDFNDFKLLCKIITKYLLNLKESGVSIINEVEIISGTARGADQLGEKYAKLTKIKVKRFPSDWNKYGKSAGYIRNKEMAQYAAESDGVLFAFWDGISKGTIHMMNLARKYGLDVHVIKYEELEDDNGE